MHRMQIEEKRVYRFQFQPTSDIHFTFDIPASDEATAIDTLKTSLEVMMADLEQSIYHREEKV
jgi:hypothetical protein